MAQVFKYALRHELISATITGDGRPTNPVVLARSESGSGYEAIVVTSEQMIVILKELDTPETRLEWTLALVHAATAPRPEETFGLKWMDVDWQNDQINIRRGWSKGRETPGKNKARMTQLVMHPALAQVIQAWRQEAVYHRDRDWTFASARTKGRLLDQQVLLGRTISDQRQ
jgi:integrase